VAAGDTATVVTPYQLISDRHIVMQAAAKTLQTFTLTAAVSLTLALKIHLF